MTWPLSLTLTATLAVAPTDSSTCCDQLSACRVTRDEAWELISRPDRPWWLPDGATDEAVAGGSDRPEKADAVSLVTGLTGGLVVGAIIGYFLANMIRDASGRSR